MFVVRFGEKGGEFRHAEGKADRFPGVAMEVGAEAEVVVVIRDQRVLPERGEHVETGEEVRIVRFAVMLQDVQRDLGEGDEVLARIGWLLRELGAGTLKHIGVGQGEGVKAAPHRQDRLFPQDFRWLDHARGREEDCVGQLVLDEPETHEPVVDVPVGMTVEFDHVDLDPVRGESIGERGDNRLRVGPLLGCGEDQVHPDDAEGLLLEDGLAIPHADVGDHG